MSHYDQILYEARKRGEILANEYIVELYNILKDEEHLPFEDCRAKIEQDCMDLWSKATIRKFLPEEAKNPKKSRAGKLGAEQKRKLEEEEKLKPLQVIEQMANGNDVAISSSPSGARTNLAENESNIQEEQESRRFHIELNQQLESRVPSPELIEAAKIISEKDLKIKELDDLARHENTNGQLNSELYLPGNLAQAIHDIVANNNKSGRVSEIDFILRHNGSHIIAVESLSSSNSISEKSETEQRIDV